MYTINVYVINLPFHVVVRMSLTSVVCFLVYSVYCVQRVLCTMYSVYFVLCQRVAVCIVKVRHLAIN